MYGREEFFNDSKGFMSGVIIDKTNKYTGYKLRGTTLSMEYKPTDNTYIRLEGRRLQMDKNQEIFRRNQSNKNSRMEIQMNIGIFFK